MSDSFDHIENERIEILDDNGNSVVFRPMAVIGTGEELYYVFGAVQDNEEEKQRQLRLILARREEDEGGTPHYTLCENSKDVEQIVGSYIRQMIAQAAKKTMPKIIKGMKPSSSCKKKHGPFEFCYCGQKDYLQ